MREIEFPAAKSAKKVIGLLLGFCLLCLLAACDETATEAKTEEHAVALPDTFYMELKGLLGEKLKVTMQLAKVGPLFQGTYWYDNLGIPLYIDGNINTRGQISLSEQTMEGEATGEFQGKFTSQTTFEGNWTNTVTQKSLPFLLKEAKTALPKVSFAHLYQENCDNRPTGRDIRNHRVQSYSDTLCPYIDVKMISLRTGDKAVDDRITKAIVDEMDVEHENYATAEAYVGSIKDSKQFGYMGFNHSCRLLCHQGHLLCMNISSMVEVGSRSRRLPSLLHLNVDLRTGKKIRMADVFLPDSIIPLHAIGDRLFWETDDASDSLDVKPGHLELFDNFGITPGGLIFTYGVFEISRSPLDLPQVFIPYKAIDHLINWDGIMANVKRH